MRRRHKAGTPCKVEQCDSPSTSLGLCTTHYTRWKRHHDVDYVTTPEPANVRFAAKVTVMANGCHEWIGAGRDSGVYGRFDVDGRLVQAHRWAYEHAVGPIPQGLELDHLCRNTKCVNPAHLEPVTRAENLRREWNARRAQEVG